MAADERYSRFQQLIDSGKEKGYVLYDDLSDVLPGGSGEAGPELDDILGGAWTRRAWICWKSRRSQL